MVYYVSKNMKQPLCKYFGKCGGCVTQHIEYELQLENKKNLLSKLLNFEDIKVFSDDEYYYRNRMDFVFNNKVIGLRKKGTWYDIIDIEKCVISNKRLNELIKEIREFFKEIDAFDIIKHTGTFRYSVIRTPQQDSSISFVLNSNSTKLEQANEKIKEFSKITTANNIIITYVQENTDVSISEDYFIVKGNDFLKEEFFNKTFKYPIQGFFQNNYKIANKMLGYTNELIKKYETKDLSLLDLYGGVGTFGIINSELFKDVLIVESLKSSIDAANENIKENYIKNTKAIILDAIQLKKLEFKNKLFVITDPPRSGMHLKTIEQLKKLRPEVIIYVSCNPQQLAKDVEKFKKYKINSVAIFDLFPQTNHSEAIVELVKDNVI